MIYYNPTPTAIAERPGQVFFTSQPAVAQAGHEHPSMRPGRKRPEYCRVFKQWFL